MTSYKDKHQIDITDANEPDFTVQVLVDNPTDIEMAVGNLEAALFHLEHQEGSLAGYDEELTELKQRLNVLIMRARTPF